MFITILLILFTVALMIAFNALYVAAEFATVSARRTRINQLAGQGNWMAQQLLPIMEDSKKLDTYVASCQIGITISSLVVGIYGENAISPLLIGPMASLIEKLEPVLNVVNVSTSPAIVETAAESTAFILVLASITTLQVIMGELFPKSVAIQFPERLAVWLVIPMRLSEYLFLPLLWLFNGSGRFLLRLLGQQAKDGHSHAHSPEEIELLVTEGHESGLLDDQERQMLRNAFRLRELTARQVMVHRTKLTAAATTSKVSNVLEAAIDGGFSRIPIYSGSIDNVQAFVHVKDLFRLQVLGEEKMDSIHREVIHVPETLPVLELWERLNVRRKYLAIVFDEYGGTAGIITFEDLIEEIFGELQDEFDDEMALIARDQDGRIHLRADLLVTDVNEYLELTLPEAVADTLSGLLFSKLGRTPKTGDEVTIGGTVMRVEAMADLGVSEVSLQLPAANNVSTYTEWEVADYE